MEPELPVTQSQIVPAGRHDALVRTGAVGNLHSIQIHRKIVCALPLRGL